MDRLIQSMSTLPRSVTKEEPLRRNDRRLVEPSIGTGGGRGQAVDHPGRTITREGGGGGFLHQKAGGPLAACLANLIPLQLAQLRSCLPACLRAAQARPGQACMHAWLHPGRRCPNTHIGCLFARAKPWLAAVALPAGADDDDADREAGHYRCTARTYYSGQCRPRPPSPALYSCL